MRLKAQFSTVIFYSLEKRYTFVPVMDADKRFINLILDLRGIYFSDSKKKDQKSTTSGTLLLF